MIRTQVYIPDDLYREAKLTAHLQDTNISKIIRQGLEQVLRRAPQTRKSTEKFGKGFFGAWKGKVRKSAVEEIHDYYERDAV